MKQTLDRLGRLGAWPLLGFALVLRLPGLRLTVEHYGDAPVRIEAAERWALSPHLWRGFGETFQYGPLHLTLLGALLRLDPDRFLVPRLLSLGFGLLSVWMLFLLARRNSVAAAWLAAAGLALDTVHLQASTSAASEVVFLGLLLLCLELLARSGALPLAVSAPPPADTQGTSQAQATRPWPLFFAALSLGAAGLVRYDGWILAALICGLLLLRVRARLLRLAPLVLFAAVAALPALAWMGQNLLESGDPLRPLHHINQDHRALAAQALRWFGNFGYRIYCLGYWPLNLLVLSSPLLGLLSLWGSLRALWRREAGWELAALAWAPAAYFTVRGTVLADFRPMSRFVLTAAALSLPFAWSALEDAARWVARRDPQQEGPWRRALVSAGLSLAVATPLFFFAASYGQNSSLAEWARPLSPISSVPPGVAQAAVYLRDHARPGEPVLLDGVWDYLEIPLAFESGLPETQLIRRAYDNFEEKLGQVTPEWAVLLYQGNLQWTPGADGASLEADAFGFRGLRFCREAKFVYASVFRRCPARSAR